VLISVVLSLAALVISNRLSRRAHRQISGLA
jgi:hypothetical protein